MASILGEHMDAARRRHFVGREKERRLFEEALEAEPLPFHILHLEGPPGIGKTTLLHYYEHLCREGDIPAYYIDAHDVEQSPDRLLKALHRRTGLDLQSGDLENQRMVLMIDSFEALTPMERWFRDDFLPHLPSDLLLVLSSLAPLPAAWRADGGLQSVLRVLSLRNLRPAESRHFLQERNVPEHHHECILQFAHGHPMALSLVADTFDQQPDWSFEPLASPDLVGALLKRFIKDVPSHHHRTALETAALVRATTEPLLAYMLEEDDVRPLFEWLRDLSFIETTRGGLVPHYVAREVITTDLQWRNQERYDQLHRHARRYYTTQLQDEALGDPTGILTDYGFLYRDNPIIGPHFRSLRAQWKNRDALTRTAIDPEDEQILREMVARHEGDESVGYLDFWRARRPDTIDVYRKNDGQPAGFTLTLPLETLSPEEIDTDPATRSAVDYLENHAPLREDERATLFRFWMDAEKHQQISPVQSLISAHRIKYYLQIPRLAFTFIPCLEPEEWALIMAYGDMHRLPEADFNADGRTCGMFGHDWRITPPAAWLELVADRDISSTSPEEVPSSPTATTLVLSRPAFEEAVKTALQDYTRPEALRANPLLRSRLVIEAGAAPEETVETRIQVLQNLLRDTADSLQNAPRETKFYRTVEATYLDPAPTQERAAELLELPFSTFRRHLRSGVELITEELWRRETGLSAIS